MKHRNNPVIAVTTWWERTERMTEFVSGIASPIYRNMTTGEELPSPDLPVGALWAVAGGSYKSKSDGLCVVCRLPGGHNWYIDGRASNCTLPEDRKHRCWVRHGTVGEPVTVDKDGRTCRAGAGSIRVDDIQFHAYLRNGELVQA